MSNSSYTVEAVLKANDSGFSNAFKNAQKSVSGLSSMAAKTGSMFKSVLGANLVSSALTSGISAISGGIRSMGTELNSSQKAWKTFEGNLQAFGRSSEQIAAAKSEMQDFATQTIYSASDMASTYSQLDAVGTKNVGSLVKAFGGLAASAENPAQAMKSISMQATQMASKPKIAWMDFKIMMEQAPAGMAAVAKEMGMSTDELVAAVQDGKVNTEEFFDAMNRAGNSEAFQKMATEFKTVDQAIDGAKETLSNKLMPAFEKLNQFGIKAVVALTDALDNIDFGKIADNLGKTLDSIDIEGMFSKAQTAMKMFFNPLFVINFKAAIDEVKGAVGALTSAFSGVAGGGWSWVYTLSNAVSALIGTVATGASIVKKFINTFADTGAMQQIKFAIDSVITAYTTLTYAVGEASIWSTLGTVIGNVAKVIAQVVQAIADFISRLDPSIVQGFTNVLVGGIAGLLAFSAGIKLVSTGMKGLDFIKSFNPFKLFKKNAEDSLDGTTNSVSRSKSTIAQLFSGLTNLIKGVGTSFKSIFDGIGKTLTGLGKTFEGFGKGVGAVLKGLMQGLKGLNPATLLSFGAAIGIAAVGIGSGIGIIVASLSLLAEHSAGVSVIIQALGTAFATVAAAIIGAFAQAIVTVSGVLPVVTSALANLAPLVVAVGVAIGSTAPAITALGDAISAVVASVGVALPPIIAAISNAITQIGLMLGTILPPIITSLGTAISQVATAITPIVGIISGAFVQIVTVVSNAIVQIIQALSPFIPAITEMVVAVAPVLSQIVDAFNNLISQISPIIDSIGNLFKSLGTAIETVLNGASNVVNSFGNSIRTVLDGVAGIFESMGNSAKNAGTAVRKQMEDIITIMSNYVHVISEQLLEANKTIDGIYSHNTTNVTMGTATGYVAYKPFRVVKGQSYHLWNIALYFTKIQYDDGSIAMLSESSDPVSVSTPWTPQKSGYLYVTITKPNYDAGTFGISNGPRNWQKYNENNSYIDNYDESSIYEIVVKKDGTGDYTSLTQAVKSIPDFSDKQYTIKIYTGTYDLLAEAGGDSFLAAAETGGNRNGLSLINKNVRLVGVGNVILNMLIPDSKTTTNTAQNISAIECAYHNELENITVNGQNIRYVVHDETGNSAKYNNTIHRFKNCKFKHLGNKSGVWINVAAYAAGTSSGCQYEFDNCIFISPSYSAWSMHNNANQESCKITIDGCVFSGTYTFDTDPLAVKFGYYGKNVNRNDIFIKNCQIASGKIGIRKETSSVESDNVWDPHNFTDIGLVIT